jgi:hypothetical protein
VIGSNKVASVKIEPNYVIRGCIVLPQLLPNSPKVQEIHGFVAINVLSFGELFGGKICAALDRQHPRDLFDAKHLLAKEGITREVACGFIVSLLSHNRPPHEVLNPNVQPQETAFFEEFAGMAEEDFSYKDHMDVLHNLIAAVNSALSPQDKAFLISFFEATPKWDFIEIDKICELPSVNWKLKNLNLLKERNPQKFAEQVEQLQRVLA